MLACLASSSFDYLFICSGKCSDKCTMITTLVRGAPKVECCCEPDTQTSLDSIEQLDEPFRCKEKEKQTKSNEQINFTKNTRYKTIIRVFDLNYKYFRNIPIPNKFFCDIKMFRPFRRSDNFHPHAHSFAFNTLLRDFWMDVAWKYTKQLNSKIICAKLD